MSCISINLKVLEMKKEVTEQEWELLEAIRNFKCSRHNPSSQLEAFALQLFDEMMYDLED